MTIVRIEIKKTFYFWKVWIFRDRNSISITDKTLVTYIK